MFINSSIKMDQVTKYIIIVSLFIADVFAEVCYEYKNSNTRAFECADGCCGSSSDAYCCMSPILIIGIVVGCIAGIIIIAVIIFVCYQKHKQRQLNKIMQIEIDQTDDEATPRRSKSKDDKKLKKEKKKQEKEKKKLEKKNKKQAKGGTISTTHGHYYPNASMTTNGIGGGYNNGVGYYNNQSLFQHPDPATYPPPPPPCPRTGTWLLNTNNNTTAKKELKNLPPPPPPPAPAIPIQRLNLNNNTNTYAMGPLGEHTSSTAAVFNIPVVGSLPAHPGAAELYVERAPIKPLPGSLPPLPPLQPK